MSQDDYGAATTTIISIIILNLNDAIIINDNDNNNDDGTSDDNNKNEMNQSKRVCRNPPESTGEPGTYEEAITCSESNEWKKAIEEELNAHKKNVTWTVGEEK